MNSDASQVSIAMAEEKPFTFTCSRLVGDQVRALTISGIAAGAGKACEMNVSPELDELDFGNRHGLRNVQIFATTAISTSDKPAEKQIQVSLPNDHRLRIKIPDWTNLALQTTTEAL